MKSPEERKHHAETIIRAHDVPVNEHLPPIEAASACRFRTRDEIVDRALALLWVALKGEGLELPYLRQLYTSYRIADKLSAAERRFADNAEPTQQDLTQATWRYESFWVLLWALGFVERLEWPTSLCSPVSAVSRVFGGSENKFRKTAVCRPEAALLDEADLIYRLHWAVRQAALDGLTTPGDLNSGVVYERHYTLNWLIGYGGQDWDTIATAKYQPRG